MESSRAIVGYSGPVNPLTGQGFAANGAFLSRGLSLEQRLWEKTEIREPWECWLWTGSKTSGGDGRSKVHYGNLSEGKLDGGNPKRNWRAHLLACLLKPETLKDVPRDAGEELIPWLRRARRYFIDHLGLQASHQCDLSLCVNPNHLEWESQEDNLSFQRWREEKRKIEPGWVPRCCERETYLSVAVEVSDGR